MVARCRAVAPVRALVGARDLLAVKKKKWEGAGVKR